MICISFLLMYGFGSSEIDFSTCYKGRPEKVLIEDPFSSIIKTNPQELLRPTLKNY